MELNLPDMRTMHLEKVLTLLGWSKFHNLFAKVGLDQVRFPIYAYPSRIIVARAKE